MKKIMFNDKFGLTQAVLDGTKTMTRRSVPQSLLDEYDTWYEDFIYKQIGLEEYLSVEEYVLNLTAYKVGEVVAIAQSYHNLNKSGYTAPEWLDHVCESSAGYENKMFVRADLMPHHIKITDVKVERLQDISDEDILKEGVYQFDELFYVSKDIGYAPEVAFPTAREAFWYLIDSISGKGTWESNPWVAAYSFELED
ncbi:hypothetical protein [Segatella salivae]|uniref:hypothetical protein n=1 Tax=Segatella salivae TaxID=228604 RepID=UPI00248E9DFD|nr:hypothetical protein [Segatella salivae]